MDYNEFVLAMKAVALPAWNMENLVATGMIQKGSRRFARDVL